MRWPGKIPAAATSDAMLMTIDLLPTLANLIGAKPPELPIDGKDVWPLIAGKEGATNPHEAYAVYYAQNELQAMISGDGKWKLLLPHGYRTLNGRPGGTDGMPVNYQQSKITRPELYQLGSDIGEKIDVAARHPDIVAKLTAAADQTRAELGDSLTGVKGRANRQPGRAKAAGMEN